MKTENKMELVEQWYWSCPVEKHRHRTQAVAQACCNKRVRIEKRWTQEAIKALAGWSEVGKR